MKSTDLAWAAGFLDGEGCIRIAPHTGRTNLIEYYLVVTAGQISKEPLEKLQTLFGGTLYFRPATRGNRRPVWDWRVYGTQVLTMLNLVLPYLTVKKAEAQLVLNGFLMPGSGHYMSNEEREQRRVLSLRLQEVKRNYA